MWFMRSIFLRQSDKIFISPKKILGCIFSKKLVFGNGKDATSNFTEPVQLIMRISKGLGRSQKKTGSQKWPPVSLGTRGGYFHGKTLTKQPPTNYNKYSHLDQINKIIFAFVWMIFLLLLLLICYLSCKYEC